MAIWPRDTLRFLSQFLPILTKNHQFPGKIITNMTENGANYAILTNKTPLQKLKTGLFSRKMHHRLKFKGWLPWNHLWHRIHERKQYLEVIFQRLKPSWSIEIYHILCIFSVCFTMQLKFNSYLVQIFRKMKKKVQVCLSVLKYRCILDSL